MTNHINCTDRTELRTRMARMLDQGWRVESDTGDRVVLVKGEPKEAVAARQKKPNHLLHLLISVFTLGIWIPVWVIMSGSSTWGRIFGRMRAGEERTMLSVE